MNSLRPALVLALSLALLAPSTVFADGWKFPNLNPFKKSKPAARRNVSDSGGFQLPKLPTPKMEMPKMEMPKMPKMGFFPASSKKRGPSTWQRMNNGAKSMMTKTKNTLMPWTKPDSSAASPQTYRTARNTSSEKKTSFFPSWFGDREEEKPVRSPEDFLAQPRLPAY